jgi:translation initiation factor 2 subunit 3
MPVEETHRKQEEDSDSDEEEEEKPQETVPKIDVDVTKLTPLSPEVISKQVSLEPFLV